MLPKVTLGDLKPGELEISDYSKETKQYQCRHEGAISFVLVIGAYSLRSPLILQDKLCPSCVRQYTCNMLVRCPVCQQVYEVVGGDEVSMSSICHFAQCLPNCVKAI